MKADNSVSGGLELEKYLGDWYEVARFNHRFERGISHSKANYSLTDDGRIAVQNTGLKDGVRKVAKGKTKFTDKYLWILSRTPQLAPADKATILAEASRRGYNVDDLIWVEQ